MDWYSVSIMEEYAGELETSASFLPAASAGAARPRRVRTASASGMGMSSARTNSVAFSTASEVSPHMYTCKSSSASGSLPLRRVIVRVSFIAPLPLS